MRKWRETEKSEVLPNAGREQNEKDVVVKWWWWRGAARK